jgi:hypothetical protein
LRELLAAYLREELMAREARALRLDENDTFVRRWLAQKVEFLVQDTAQLPEPSVEDLRRCYEANRERFAVPAQITFTQDFAMLPQQFSGDQMEVTKVFGAEFARQVFALSTGGGTVTSPYGRHAVRVTGKQPARQRDLVEAGDQVLETWRQEQARQNRQQYFASLLKKYDVEVDDSVRPLLGPLTEVVQ